MKTWLNPAVIALSVIILLSTSCDERNAQKESDLNQVELDSTKSTIVNISGKLFSIPSPIQTASLIDRDNTPYRRDVLAYYDAIDNVPERNMKAMNLGVLGIDMVYSSFYEDAQSSLNYYKAVDQLATNLEIKSAIDQNLIKRVGSNVDKPDSLIYLSSEFYESLDAYLKENDRTEIAALVLTGAWIESTMLTALSENESAREALAAQKKASSTLYNLISKIDLNNTGFQTELDSLNSSFQKIEKTYKYNTPDVFPDEKRTVIQSESTYNISDSLKNDIQNRLIKLHHIING